MALNVTPLHDRILIKRLEDSTKQYGSIITPDTVTEKPMQGEVLAVGKGKLRKDGARQEPAVKTGDRVVFSKWSGDEFEYEGEKFLMLSEEDVLAVL